MARSLIHRWALAICVSVLSASVAWAEPMVTGQVAGQVTVSYPGETSAETVSSESPGYPALTASSQSIFLPDAHYGAASGTANITTTGNLFSQAAIGGGAAPDSIIDGPFSVDSAAAYVATVLPTADGQLTFTFHVLQQVMEIAQLASDANGANTRIEVSLFVDGTEVYGSFETLSGNTSSASQLIIAATSFSVTVDAFANVPITLQYNITTHADIIKLTIPGPTNQVLAQYGDPFDINTPPVVTITFDAADATEVPEPSALVTMLVVGMAGGLGLLRLRRKAVY
ncbi:MAG TPA: hypothetical protein VL096_15375 [Pirellulaceae bacterium]|nr:hypothetical protein [Pirellulaceae bacterium]